MLLPQVEVSTFIFNYNFMHCYSVKSSKHIDFLSSVFEPKKEEGKKRRVFSNLTCHILKRKSVYHLLLLIFH